MTFREYNLAIMRDLVLGKLLPLECRKTYPRFELEGGGLCACFAGYRMKPVEGGVEVQAPSFYLKLTVPGCAIRAFVKFSGRSGETHRMTPQTPETIQTLTSLCDRVLREFEENSAQLGETVAEYNALLDKILEPEQLEVLERMARL